MQVLFAVAEDLYTFAASLLFPRRMYRRVAETRLYTPAPRAILSVEDLVSEAEDNFEDGFAEEVPASSFAEASEDAGAVRAAVPAVPVADTAALPRKNTIVYCVRQTLLSAVPNEAAGEGAEDEENNTALIIPYGTLLMALEVTNGWTRIAMGERTGYVPTNAVAERAGEVFPDFAVVGANGPTNVNTLRLRRVIGDEFGAGSAGEPLGAHEYVYYKLLRRGARIVWPEARPRIAGAWARILRGSEGMAVGDEPTAGTVMEFALLQENVNTKAHLAYVEKVLPDQSIEISEADWPESGIYNERTLSALEWRALAPVFISIS